MTHDLKLTLSRSESMISMIPEEVKNNITPGISHEVFRNNTTAVEVIVKEVPNKTKKKREVVKFNQNTQNHTLQNLKKANENLVNELKHSSTVLQRTRNNFNILINEMKKQLDEANSREVEIQRKFINLQLESEKLKSLLESKTNLIGKFKKELNNLKRIVKIVVKGILVTPPILESCTFISGAGYEEFKSDLRKDFYVKYVSNVMDSGPLT